MSSQEPSGVAGARLVLRSLSVGLSVYRLYPDNPDASSFAGSAARIRAAIGDALATGPLGFQVRSGRFLVDGTTITDPGVDRLAQACFERRVEQLGFEAVPGVEELWFAFSLLTADPMDLERDGGVAMRLAAAKVTAIVATAGAPAPTSGQERPEQLLGLEGGLETVEIGEEEQRLEDLTDVRLLPDESGAALYTRLAVRSTTFTADGAVRSSFYQRAARVVDELPDHERADFARRLIDDLVTEPFAERYAGHLTDLALAELIATLARHEGRDPAALATEVGTAAERHTNLQNLLRPGDDPGAGRYASMTGATGFIEDVRLRAEFPMTATDDRALAALTLVDVLLAEPRPEQLVAVVDNAIERLREAVRAGAHGPIGDLLGALDTAAREGPTELAGPLGRPRTEALTPEVVASAAWNAIQQRRVLDPQLFVPFGRAAIAPVLGALARERDAPVAARLTEILVVLARDRVEVLQAELDRQPPEMVVRLASACGAAGMDAVALLSRVALRAEPAMLAPVVDALSRRRSEDAHRVASVLAGIARRPVETELRHVCLDAMARLPGGVGSPHLAALAAGEGGPALPWRSRRRARRLARDTAGRR